VKAAPVEPAETVTEDGICSDGLFDDSEMAVPPEGAALVNVAVQEVDWPAENVLGVHCRLDNPGVEPVTESEALAALPFREAVRLAVVAPPEVLAVKIAVVDPAATVTEAGTVTLEALLDSATDVAAVGAMLSVTVQVLLDPAATLEGLQERAVTLGMVTEPTWEMENAPEVAVKYRTPVLSTATESKPVNVVPFCVTAYVPVANPATK
jgi:hypothetical protein